MKTKLLVLDVNNGDANKIKSIFPFSFFECTFCRSMQEMEAYINDFKKILILSVNDQEKIVEEIIGKYSISRDKFIYVTEYANEQLKESYLRFNFGIANCGKTFYVIPCAENVGLFYMFNYVLRQLFFVKDTCFVPAVDMQYHKNIYSDEKTLTIKNAWEYYFEQLTDISLSEIYCSSDVIICSKNMNSISYDGFSYGKRIGMYRTYIRETDDLRNRAEQSVGEIFGDRKNVLGVLGRGTDYANNYRPYLHPIPYDAFELCEKVSEYAAACNYEYIYLATEDQFIFEQFKKRFGNRLLSYGQQRFASTGSERMVDLTLSDKRERRFLGYDYYLSIFLLAQCDRLIGTSCASIHSAITLNEGKYKSVTVLQKGKYGLSGEHPLVIERTGRNLIAISLKNGYVEKDETSIHALPDGKFDIKSLGTHSAEFCLAENVETFIPKGYYSFTAYLPSGCCVRLELTDVKGNVISIRENGLYPVTQTVVKYDIYATVNKDIDQTAWIMFEKGVSAGYYVQPYVSTTEIGLKDSDGNFFDLQCGDQIDFESGVCYSANGNRVLLSKTERINYSSMVRYSGGIVRFKYKGKYIGAEQVILHYGEQ